jgi:hypothetical protein
VIGSSIKILISFWNGNRALKITTATIIYICEGIVIDAPCEVTANMLRIHHLLVRVAIALGGGGESESGHSQLSPLPLHFVPNLVTNGVSISSLTRSSKISR